MLEADPGMAELINANLNQLESGMIARQGNRRGKMRKRVAFVFVSSPNSVTPVHFDIEHSLLMMVKREEDGQHRALQERRGPAPRGRQVLGRLPRPDREPASGGRHVHHDAGAGGVYIPPGTPHWVHNGPDSSLSVSPPYFTAATVRREPASRTSTHTFGGGI